MRHKRWLFLFLIMLCVPSYGYAQPWSGIVAPSRAVDWSLAGVQGDIPSSTWAVCNTTACNNIAPGGTGSVTGATIQSAIDGAQVGGVSCSASAPCVVRVRAGNFTLTNGFTLASGRVVRGVGANQTLLTINGESVGDRCGYFYRSAIALCGHPPTQTTTNWTAGYTKGATRITLSARNGLVPGKTPLFLNQLNEASDGYPSAGDIYICDAAGACSSAGGGACRLGGAGVCGRATSQLVMVTSCVGGACSGGGDVDITPPLAMPNFRSGQAPNAFWGDGSAQAIQWAGVEDLSVDYSAVDTGVEMINASNVWVKGVRIIYNGSFNNFSIMMANTVFATLRSNYIFNPSGLPQASYPMQCIGCGAMRIENNICQGTGCALVSNGSYSNSVFAYNFTPGHDGPGYIRHGAGEAMNLVEGNVMKGVWNDVQEGTGHFMTAFRNALIGNRYNAGGASNIQSAFMFTSHARFNNVVGNAVGDSSLWTTYQGQANGLCSIPSNMYDLGGTSCGGGSISSDPRVSATLFRFGNWDEITSTSPGSNGDQTGTRWCGNASNTGWTTRCASTTEVPSSIPNYSNPIPATETLPASFYYTARPTWWPIAKPWPAIGPDVTGGNIANMGGHAYTNPAADCYLSVMGGAPGGGGSPLSFNPAECYGSSSGAGNPSAPTNPILQ